MYRVTVIPTVNDASADDLAGNTAIVIDVLRATSTILTALQRGCSDIIPVETVCQAKDMLREGNLLAGERNGRKLPGFDLGNSPLEYASLELKDKTIIMTTTNGTRAIHKAAKASQVIIACNLNARAAANYALSLKKNIVIVCAGTKDRFSLEDGLCAGLLLEEMSKQAEEPLLMNDFATAMKSAYQQAKDCFTEMLLNSFNGRRLVRAGYQEDVIYCSQRNISNLVPILTHNTLRAQVLKRLLVP